ncbi:MAG: hypothetical protein IPJ31_15340 [Bacteroidetes bacterium]|nr:hypothetical protein [Bacteroidota bacterium]
MRYRTKQTKPIFDYTIYADVTDLNGETRSGETIVSVGYESLLLKIETPEYRSISIISMQ